MAQRCGEEIDLMISLGYLGLNLMACPVLVWSDVCCENAQEPSTPQPASHSGGSHGSSG